MAKSSKSKIPLRGIAKLFNHLSAGLQARLSSAFGEAEDLFDYHNRSAVDQQERRSISGLVAAPQLRTSTNNRGFVVEWDRLDDRRISLYEVQVSYTSNFSNPDTYSVVDTSLSIEGVGTTAYVRVRGVRFDGDCGPWSDSATIDAFATNSGPVVYSRGFDDVPSFYISAPYDVYPDPIQHLYVTPQKQNGGIVVFGSIGLENATLSAGDKLDVALNGFVMSTTSLTPVAASPDPTHLTLGFGPAFLSHANFTSFSSPVNNPGTFASTGSHGSSGVHIGWTNNGVLGVMENPATAGADAAEYEVSGLAAGENDQTEYLKLTGFGFAIPGGNTVNGIKVEFLGQYTLNNIAASGYPQVSQISLVDAGTIETYTPTTTAQWPQSLTVPASYGGSSDLWNQAAGYWTAAKINAATFGVAIRAKCRKQSSDTTPGDGQVNLWVYGLEMTVYSTSTTTNEARIDVLYYSPLDSTSTLRTCTLNVIEFGEDL